MELSPTNLKRFIVNALHRYHVIIFVVFVLGGLVIAVFMLNNIIVQSGNIGDYAPKAIHQFDEKTMERIEQLKTRDDPESKLDLSNGRANPFVE